MNNDDITFEIPRFRYLAFTYSVGFLGFLILFNSFTLEDLLANLFFLLIGVSVIFFALKIYQTRDKGLRITNDGLFEKDGNLICCFDEIEMVDNSPFSFKATIA